MSLPVRILAVGSPHGDDQIGWLIADLLRLRGVESTFSLQSVDELLRYLSQDSRVILIDACRSGAPVGRRFRLRWPDFRTEGFVGSTSHGISLPYVLRLAEVLGTLPAEVVLYAIEIGSSRPTAEMAPELITTAYETADCIERELVAKGSSEPCMNDPWPAPF